MTTKVTFDDTEQFTRWMVVDEATITGNKIKLKLNEPEFWDVDAVLSEVNHSDEFQIDDIDFEEKILIIEVNR